MHVVIRWLNREWIEVFSCYNHWWPTEKNSMIKNWIEGCWAGRTDSYGNDQKWNKFNLCNESTYPWNALYGETSVISGSGKYV